MLSVNIRGIRSYSPREDLAQNVDFMPLTLIVGSNGTGKTTLIEALKFMISGEEPPHSDCRRNFIHTPRSEKEQMFQKEPYACIEIRFRNSSNELCIAKREITRVISGAKTAPPPTITSSYKIGHNSWITVHKQDDWNSLLPKLFGLPNQAILSNVILCHQEENLWCMGDSTSVKLIFDKIFGCEQYKKEIKHIDDEIRGCKKDLLISEKDTQLFGDKVKRKKAIRGEIEKLQDELNKLHTNIHTLDGDIDQQDEKKQAISKRITDLESKSREVSSLRQTARELRERDGILRRSLQPFLIRRRAPPPPPVKKKLTVDPTATELGYVIENLDKMEIVTEVLPPSSNVDNLKGLVRDSKVKVVAIRDRFASPAPIEEPPVEEPEPEENEEENEYKRTIEADIRENQRKMDSIKESIELIEKQIKDDEELNQARTDLREAESRLMKLRDERSRMTGTKMQIERELRRVKAELEDHRSANTSYAESLGRFVCNKIVISDLEKLKKCFQESITSFHDQMIVKINEALRAKWRQIYQGRDIDHIELVDEEITRGKDKKSFNYYMAMRKGGVRMRMKEKSSAGQRALASIILRMTLAELFVRNFAFIALDEPTANLDLSNVQALAKAIGAYVRRRSKTGANIQWIIITHDEQFLKALDEECSPFFYRTRIGPEGYSEIVKMSYYDTVASSLETEQE